MPIYEYRCRACGHEFEREQRITDDPLEACPSCGAAQAKRLISRTSFHLKGGGWYSDLYGSSGAKKSKKGEGAGEAAKADSGSGASDAGKSGEAGSGGDKGGKAAA
jgi:putative FmdB family regulatory protein